jgi:hypothetical protein
MIGAVAVNPSHFCPAEGRKEPRGGRTMTEFLAQGRGSGRPPRDLFWPARSTDYA